MNSPYPLPYPSWTFLAQFGLVYPLFLIIYIASHSESERDIIFSRAFCDANNPTQAESFPLAASLEPLAKLHFTWSWSGAGGTQVFLTFQTDVDEDIDREGTSALGVFPQHFPQNESRRPWWWSQSPSGVFLQKQYHFTVWSHHFTNWWLISKLHNNFWSHIH